MKRAIVAFLLLLVPVCVSADVFRISRAVPSTVTNDGANTLALRNGTTAQTLRIYNTYTDASNYERAAFTWTSNLFVISSDAAGTGTVRTMLFATGGANRFAISATGLTPAGDLLYDVGASSARVRNAWLSRIHATGTAPTSVTVGTGFGTSPTIAFDTGSADTAGTIVVTVGSGGTATSGSAVVTFSAALGTNTARCVATPVNGSGAWTSKATVIISAQSTTATTFFAENNGVALTAAATYKINYVCFGG